MGKTIQIPDTGIKVFPLGLGTTGAGSKWGDHTAYSIFDAFTENGGNLIDTARVYSMGKSESVIGSWLEKSGKRDKIILMTKGGHPKYESPLDDLHIPRMTARDMRDDLEASLRELRTDYIDIYFYHRDNQKQSIEEEIETMETFRREGKIRFYACSNWSVSRMEESEQYCKAKGYRGFVADQAMLNLGVKYMNPMKDDTLMVIKDELYQYHVKHPENIAMPFMSAAGGFFHKYISGESEKIKDNPFNTPGNRMVAEKCRELMQKYNATVTQILIGFFSSVPFRTIPLYGPKDAAQIEEAIRAVGIEFSKEDYTIKLE